LIYILTPPDSSNLNVQIRITNVVFDGTEDENTPLIVVNSSIVLTLQSIVVIGDNFTLISHDLTSYPYSKIDSIYPNNISGTQSECLNLIINEENETSEISLVMNKETEISSVIPQATLIFSITDEFSENKSQNLASNSRDKSFAAVIGGSISSAVLILAAIIRFLIFKKKKVDSEMSSDNVEDIQIVQIYPPQAVSMTQENPLWNHQFDDDDPFHESIDEESGDNKDIEYEGGDC
jgi:hypothetical protein